MAQIVVDGFQPVHIEKEDTIEPIRSLFKKFVDLLMEKMARGQACEHIKQATTRNLDEVAGVFHG